MADPNRVTEDRRQAPWSSPSISSSRSRHLLISTPASRPPSPAYPLCTPCLLAGLAACRSAAVDRWTDPSLVPSAKRLKLAHDGPTVAPPAQGAAASAASQWAANMTGSGDGGRQVNGGGVASAVDNRAGMGDDDGIDVGMDG